MRGNRNYCNLPLQVLLLLISLTVLPIFSEAKHHKHRLQAFVIGSVSYDTRFIKDDYFKSGHFLSGATVSVECNVDGAFKAITRTNKHGKFKLHLPLSIATRPETDLIKGCRVSLLKSTDPYCSITPSTARSSPIRHLKSRKQTRVFSAGHFSIKSNVDGIESQKSFLGPIMDGPLLGLGPILQPVLPQLPPLLGLPNPLQPPSTPSFGFPGLPGLTPSPPAFPIPFPSSVPNSARKASP